MVYGIGGFKFSDYTKVGLPLIFINFLVSLILLPILHSSHKEGKVPKLRHFFNSKIYFISFKVLYPFLIGLQLIIVKYILWNQKYSKKTNTNDNNVNKEIVSGVRN